MIIEVLVRYTVGLTHDFGQPEEVNVSERQGVKGRLGAHFKGFEE